MQLVAVVDLMAGCVVHARRGMRNEYRPIQSGLCASAAAPDIVAALLRLHAFDALYIADLDAILGRGDNWATIRMLREDFPHLSLWVDAGMTDAASCAAFLDADLGTPVLGSESLVDIRLGEILRESGHAAILSLDFSNGRPLGSPAVFEHAELWPRRLLAMNLDRVGSDLGPDLALLSMLQTRAAQCNIYLAGGIRDRADLKAAQIAGAAGVLLASALHARTLSPADLARFGDDPPRRTSP